MKILSTNIIHHFFSKNREGVSSGPEYGSSKRTVRHHKKIILNLLLKKSKIFEWQVSLLFFVLDNKKLTSHMAQISEHINYLNNNSFLLSNEQTDC